MTDHDICCRVVAEHRDPATLPVGEIMSDGGFRFEAEETHRYAVALTKREREIMTLLVMGHSNRAVGLELGISPRTIEVHRRSIDLKMRARNIADLVRMSILAPS